MTVCRDGGGDYSPEAGGEGLGKLGVCRVVVTQRDQDSRPDPGSDDPGSDPDSPHPHLKPSEQVSIAPWRGPLLLPV